MKSQELLLTLVNSVIAWKVTTQQTFPEVLVKLQEHRQGAELAMTDFAPSRSQAACARQWISPLADEPLDFHSVGHDSATL
mmetsp:Transcript_60087/g.112245  ORF Transcript_60087/g.112245 Transcript_60087/m.112245 type:complete len:81 (+) Transcript_60087:64-306(+)